MEVSDFESFPCRYKELQLKFHPDKCLSTTLEESTHKASRLNRAREIILRAHKLSNDGDGEVPATSAFPQHHSETEGEKSGPKSPLDHFPSSSEDVFHASRPAYMAGEENKTRANLSGSYKPVGSTGRILTNFFEEDTGDSVGNMSSDHVDSTGKEARSRPVLQPSVASTPNSSLCTTTTQGSSRTHARSSPPITQTTHMEKMPADVSSVHVAGVAEESSSGRPHVGSRAAVPAAEALGKQCPQKDGQGLHAMEPIVPALAQEQAGGRGDSEAASGVRTEPLDRHGSESGAQQDRSGAPDTWEDDFDYVTAAAARPSWDVLMSNLSVLSRVGLVGVAPRAPRPGLARLAVPALISAGRQEIWRERLRSTVPSRGRGQEGSSHPLGVSQHTALHPTAPHRSLPPAAASPRRHHRHPPPPRIEIAGRDNRGSCKAASFAAGQGCLRPIRNCLRPIRIWLRVVKGCLAFSVSNARGRVGCGRSRAGTSSWCPGRPYASSPRACSAP